MRKLDGDRLVIASHNAGKVREIGALLRPLGITAVSAGDLGLAEPDETESTFEGNARIKAHAAAGGSGWPALADDSGLIVDALDGAPGVYTANWAETPTGRDFGVAMAKVWERVRQSGTAPPWMARFHATLCLAWPDGHDEVFTGEVAGTLRWPPSGTNGFGFDPMFVPNGYSETFGEMEPALKHHISHRAIAFAGLLAGSLAR